MNYLDQNWGHPFVALIGGVVIGVHLWGLHALNRRSTRIRARHRQRRLLLSLAGIMLTVLSVCSPLEYWSMQYFWIHMLQHISVMLVGPALYVAGAPSLALIHAVPVTLRRRTMRFVNLSILARPLRGMIQLVTSTLFAVISFNLVMLVWMLPGPFDFVMKSETLHISLMLSSFLFTGILFWSKIIGSYPFKPIESPVVKVGMLLVTNLIMTIIAMVIGILTSTPDYRFPLMTMVMGSMVMPTAAVTINRLIDQQIGAAILWVCGDFWCLPPLIFSIHQLLKDGSDANLVDRFLRGREQVFPTDFSTQEASK